MIAHGPGLVKRRVACLALRRIKLGEAAPAQRGSSQGLEGLDIGALIIRIGFWGPLYYNDNKEPPE